MKNYFSRLFQINTYCGVNYAFNIKNGLYNLTNATEKRRKANVCLLERDSYWQAERHYKNINIIDLPKLMKAEMATISPFPGRVFWKIKHVDLNQATIIYIVIPIEYYDIIIEKCQFIYPATDKQHTLPFISNTSPTIDLSEDSSGKSIELITELARDIKQKNILCLIGFYLLQNKDIETKSQRLSLKQLAIVSGISLLLFTAISSSYLYFNLKHYESKVVENKEAVEKALKTQRELKTILESKEEFETFLSENKNVLAIFSHINFKDEKYNIERVYLHPKGFQISGTSESSATNLLTILLSFPQISEAKFVRPVSKNRSGEDVFVIEVSFS